MDAFRRSLYLALEHERLFAVAAVASILELGLRFVLAALLHPIAFVLWPPVAAVGGVSLVGPTVRTALETEGDTTSAGRIGFGRVPALLAVAVGGHAFALALGTALFLLVDTPIRYALYFVGRGELLTQTVIVIVPLPAVALATAAAWTIPAVAVVRLVDGSTLGGAVRDAFTAPLERRPVLGRYCVVGLANAVAVALVLATIASGTLAMEALESPESTDGAFVLLAVGVALASVSTLGLAVSTAHLLERVPAMGPSSATRVPVVRLAFAALLLTVLVTAAGGIRMAEVRPVDTAPEPLPEDPDGLYATALENTEKASHAYRIDLRHTDGTDVAAVGVDRENRRYVVRSSIGPWEDERVLAYVTTGTARRAASWGEVVELGTYTTTEGRIVRVSPGYPAVDRDYELDGFFSAPSPDAAGWRVSERSAERIVLELTGPDDVLVALWSDDSASEVREANVSRAEVVVDPERGTLQEAEVRMNGTTVDDGVADPIDVHVTFEYAVDVTVDRPREVGSPAAGELLWRLFAY